MREKPTRQQVPVSWSEPRRDGFALGVLTGAMATVVVFLVVGAVIYAGLS